ncbi:MAG: rhodanese-like domain-containing protein [Chitinophagaceae bacterium]|nr:rhodanese-like domain-containing protein [Chitinophagaceae bacterium]HQV05186.1 rhodanese-like domain-containing protein [Chitinophagaceae bacterium]
MIQFFKNLLGLGVRTDYKALMQNGAQIIDVRTKAEFQQGHIKESVNIPLNNLSNHVTKLKKETPIIVCCASGMRSSSAKSLLKSNGFAAVYNGGSWIRLQNKI